MDFSSPGTGSSDKVMRLLSSYTDVTYGDCGIWQSIDGELWITQNCYWSGVNPITHLVENKWRATVTLPNKDAYAIRFKNITDSEGIGGVVFYSKSRNHAVTSGWDRTTIGGLNTWSSFIEVCNVHSVTNEDIYSCSTVSGHTYERLPIYFYYKNYTAFVIPGGNSFIVPLQYRSRYLSAPTVGSLHPHTKTVVGSIQLNTTAGVYPIEMDQWGCFVYIDVLNPLGIPSGAAVTLTGYVDVQT